jgi:outer membrane protein OmpA-like peptidoglycan-associated protein
MRHDIRLTVVASVLSLLGTGCVATRQWTNELVAKQEVEIDERVGKVETGVREHGKRLDRVEVRIGQLDTGLTETRALLRASVPPPTAPATARRPPQPEGPTAGRTLIGVVHVPFGFDRADLDPRAEAALAMIVKDLRDNPHLTVDLEGTTDPVGAVDYNLRLSQRRVASVRRWLVDRGIDSARIVRSAGRGELTDGVVQNSLKRRVVVKLMRRGG